MGGRVWLTPANGCHLLLFFSPWRRYGPSLWREWLVNCLDKRPQSRERPSWKCWRHRLKKERNWSKIVTQNASKHHCTIHTQLNVCTADDEKQCMFSENYSISWFMSWEAYSTKLHCLLILCGSTEIMKYTDRLQIHICSFCCIPEKLA